MLVVVKELTVRSWGMITQVRDAGDLGQGVPLRVGGRFWRSDEICSSNII